MAWNLEILLRSSQYFIDFDSNKIVREQKTYIKWKCVDIKNLIWALLCRNLRLNFEFRSSCFYQKYLGKILRFVSHVPWSSIISPTTCRCRRYENWLQLFGEPSSQAMKAGPGGAPYCPLARRPTLVARMVWALQCCSAAVLQAAASLGSAAGQEHARLGGFCELGLLWFVYIM